MDPTVLILTASFACVLALVFGIGSILQSRATSLAESRLAAFAGKSSPTNRQIADELVRDGLGAAGGLMGRLVKRFENLPLFFQQANCPIRAEKFLMICGGAAGLGFLITMIARAPAPLFPVGACIGGAMPWIWLWWRRRSRFKKLEKQLSDALDLMARALRSGHSLASGLNVVASEMPSPIADEFRTVFDEQNLGITMDQALRNLLHRVPNVDLQFFVTAVSIQRQAGGDLAEILDKIAGLVRERFKIFGQVKALTGEGRISGIVLMALPIGLFMTIYYLNPSYVMVLFEREEGKQMLAGAVFMQILGAICIRKLCDIKV